MLVPALRYRPSLGVLIVIRAMCSGVASSGSTPGQAAARAPCDDVPHFRVYGWLS